MRVLILNYEYPPLGGGAANATKYILREFSKYDNLEIDLITSSTQGFKIERDKNITIHYLDIGKNSKKLHGQSSKDLLVYSLKSYFYSKKLLKKKNFDLCHAFFGIPCGFIAKQLHIPYIVSLRGSDVPFYSKKYRLLDKLFFKRLSKNIWENAEFVIANSKGLKDFALNSYSKKKIYVIYNGIDTKEFMFKKRYNTKKKLQILCVGRLIERKGYSYLIEAIKPISDFVSVTFIGGGDLSNTLKYQSRNLDVTFLGIIEHDKIAKIYSKYDIFVLPSFNEGMSNTVLEAMASGLGLIVTNTGGSAELVKKNGFIIEPGNSKEITRKLKKYINNKKLLEQHAEMSRKHAKNFSWEKVSKQYFNFYKKIVNR